MYVCAHLIISVSRTVFLSLLCNTSISIINVSPCVLTECIYMEVYPPPMPYQICKIEELRKVRNFNVVGMTIVPSRVSYDTGGGFGYPKLLVI